MKTSILIITLVFALIMPMNLVYAPPSVNPDWQSYPYCPGGCPREFLVEGWSKYYDMKGEEWMEKKRIELFSAYKNGTLYDWIDSDLTKANQNVFTYYYILGEIPNSDGEFFIALPLCNDVTLTEDDDMCSTGDSPPCPEPSFKKNGMCVIEKKSLCGKGTILKNNQCVAEFTDEDICGEENVLVDGICMTKPKPSDFRDLQTGETISNPHVILIIQSLGAGLIVLFIAVYAIKKRKRK